MATRATSKGKSVVTSQVQAITPDLAGEWLNRNTHNRPIRNKWVDQLVGIINRGEWRVNGDAIRFAVDGTLLDGQHRLWAIHLSGKTVESVVMEGLATDTQITMDMGQRRRLADQLRLMGYGSATHLAATLNLKWKMDNGEVRGTLVPTIPQALKVLKDNPSIVDSLAVARRWNKRVATGSQAAISVLHYEFNSRDAGAAETYFDSIIEAVGLTPGSPLLALKRHVESARLGTVALMALMIKAWNFYLEGREVERIMWRPVGRQAEDFPQITGGT